MNRRLRIGISTCPNDTYAFAGLLSGEVVCDGDAEGLELQFELLDVQALNEGLAEGRFDVAKASFAEALRRADRLIVLERGAAIGYGVGPVLLARPSPRPPLAEGRVLLPGVGTTAALLYRLFHEGEGLAESCVFSDIMPALQSGRADYGVCIHEGRFTYEAGGLELVEDLGETWHAATSAALPLGGLFGRSDVDRGILLSLDDAISRSLAWAARNPEGAEAVMSQHAQEMSPDVLWRHVELYVNETTRDLGPLGRRALDIFHRQARRLSEFVGASPWSYLR